MLDFFSFIFADLSFLIFSTLFNCSDWMFDASPRDSGSKIGFEPSNSRTLCSERMMLSPLLRTESENLSQ